LLSYEWHFLRADIFAPIGVALAILVSMHVLLRKRDVGSAIGWIGLVWLSPLVGSAIYFVFGINRVERRARRLRRDLHRDTRPKNPPDSEIPEHLVPLEVAARQISNRAAEEGCDIQPLENGDAAYPVMLEAIASAKTSVALASYIFRDDTTGKRFSEALIAAHRRGVAVRVMIDGIGGGYFTSATYHRLRRAGVPAARFLHSTLPWRMPFLNLRSHKKILVIDGARAFTGGMNIASQNLVRENPPDPVRDIHFRVAGPVVAQLMEDFARDWNFVTDEDLEGDSWFPATSRAGPAIARVITSGPDRDIEKIAHVILEAITCARKTIRVMTPYFLPDERFVSALSLAAMRGIEVDIVVPEKGDHGMINWAMPAHVAPLLRAGVRVWRNPPPFEHTKLLVIDRVWCLIGSANWDMRSLRLNFELTMEVYHSDLPARLDEVVSHRMGNRLHTAELARRPFAIRLRDAATRLGLPYL
jgi:cardiolipin synthase